jgi:predicted nucleic acid-binding protein
VEQVTRILLDTDIFVDHLRGRLRLETGKDDAHFSSVTRAELFAGRRTEEARVRRLLQPFAELPVDRSVAERAGRIRRASGVAMADALIAATAIHHRLMLVTRNVGDFAPITSLRIRSTD